tara:strand:- start:85 stop:570 length:486 start_codon:yes stop_codon:yes gene_type:complete
MYTSTRQDRVVSFTLIKDISYHDCDVDEMCERLELLKKEDFGKVNIPNFTYEKLSNHSLRIVSNFIKGRYLRFSESKILKRYLVDRVNKPDSEYSFSDYHPNNYLACRETRKIYAIDLDDYRKTDMKDRLKKWNEMQNLFIENNRLYYTNFPTIKQGENNE